MSLAKGIMKPPKEKEIEGSKFDDGGEHHKKVDEEIEESFSLFDINGDGRISITELMSVMASVGRECTVDDAEEIMEMFDLDGDGEMNFDEFKTAVKGKFTEGVQEEDLFEAFHVFDADRDGFITLRELQSIFNKLGELITEEETAEIMRDCDSNDDGLIDFQEFKDFYKRMEISERGNVVVT